MNCENLKLLLRIDHKNNEFNVTKNENSMNVSALRMIHTKYGYPDNKQTRYYLAVADEHPLLIEQKYDSPVGGRDADILSVYEIPQPDTNFCDFEVVLLEMFSDILFNTHCFYSTEIEESEILMNTWSFFVMLALNNQYLDLNSVIFPIVSEGVDELHEACKKLTPHQVSRAFFFMNAQKNNVTGRIKAIKMACLDFDCEVNNNIDKHELLQALNTLPDCAYKKNGYLYLINNGFMGEEMKAYSENNSILQKALLSKYLELIAERKISQAKKLRVFLNPTLLSFEKFETDESSLHFSPPASMDASFDFLEECMVVSLILRSKEYKDFIETIKREIAKNQTFRHNLMCFVHETNEDNDASEFLYSLLEENNLEKTGLMLFAKVYGDRFLYDAFFVGVISYKTLKKKLTNDFSINASEISELAKWSFEKDDGILERFLRNSENTSENRKIKKAIVKNVKKGVYSTMNNEIHLAFLKIVELFKGKRRISHKIKKLKSEI